jgi:hypothetical protein
MTPARRGLGILGAAALLTSCGGGNDRAILSALRADLTEQYHECIPLGWSPVVLRAGRYYPGYDATTLDAGAWLQAIWIAVVRKNDARPAVHGVQRVLDELTRIGMLDRIDLGDRLRYHLTAHGTAFYYDEDRYGDNTERWPYMCFSRIRPDHIIWRHAQTAAPGGAPVERVAFAWTASPPNEWVTPLLRSRGVVLSPVASPAVATLVRAGDRWTVAKIDFSLPVVEDPSAWNPLRSQGSRT